jgi:cell division protein FtsB
MNEKNISIVILVTIWIFVIATFAVVSFARVKKLESVLEELYEELDEAFEEVDCEQDTFVREIKELRERIKALEKTTNTVSDIETIKNAQFGIGTIMQRYNNNETYYYMVKVDNDTAVISSRYLFSVDETVIVCKVENALFLIDIS